jgi:hypothetical protein
MPPSSRLLPAARNQPSLWVVGLLLLLAMAIIMLGVLGVVIGGELSMFFLALFYGAGPLIVSIHLFMQWLAWSQKRQEWAVRMKALGLEFQPHVTTKDLAPFLDLPLFCIGDPKRQRADFLARGSIEGREVVVLNYRYADWFLTPKRRKFLRGGIQTVALFPHVEELPDFHLSPQENDWNLLAPHWVEDLRVGRVVCVTDSGDDDPALIRTEDELAVMRLFPAERLERLGNLSGWTIESYEGRLAIYRHGEVMDADEIPYFIQRALDVVAVMTDLDKASEPRDSSGDERVLPGPPRKWTERLRKPKRK